MNLGAIHASPSVATAMKPLITILVAALAITPAHGRIGATPEQCHARYGKPTAGINRAGVACYRKDGFLILIEFHKGTACSVGYVREDGKAITETQCEVLRQANCPRSWISDNQSGWNKWLCKETGISAAQRLSIPSMLRFHTAAALEAENEAQLAKEAAGVSGL